MERVVVYTAIFGDYDSLKEPRVTPEGVDFICFTDKPIKSENWEIRVVERGDDDPTRCARMYKILPHRYLGSYDVSIWVDGNVAVVGDVTEFIETYLRENNMAVYDHAYSKHRDKTESPNPITSLKDQLDHLLKMAERGRIKDDPEIMKKQVDTYLADGYPDDQGLLQSTVLLRRHNEEDMKETMEMWWSELKKWSKRDQLSFNYAAWKTNFAFTYIKENVRNNDFFVMNSHK